MKLFLDGEGSNQMKTKAHRIVKIHGLDFFLVHLLKLKKSKSQRLKEEVDQST